LKKIGEEIERERESWIWDLFSSFLNDEGVFYLVVPGGFLMIKAVFYLIISGGFLMINFMKF
jgi:hypothetical protein